MTMKRELILSLGIAIGFSQSTSAGEPAPNLESLGMVETILSKCAAIDPEHAARYREEARLLRTRKGGELDDKSSKDTGYKWASDTATASLDALDAASTLKICKSVLVETIAPGS
jgi:hypothetical protein